MDVKIDDLLKGKATVIKNKEFFPTKYYVEPFLDRMSKLTSDFRIQVRLPDQITKVDNFEDITYNRVWIQAVMPYDDVFENHNEVIGLLYGLDIRKPVVKIYRGSLNMACTNLCVFNPSYLNVQELQPNTAIDYQPIKQLMEQTNDMRMWLEKLSDTYISRDKVSLERELGRWTYNCITKGCDRGYGKIKLATSTPVAAFKSVFLDTDSPYYTDDEQVDMFTIYNAFTQVLTDDTKDIVNKVEKTLLLKDILEF